VGTYSLGSSNARKLVFDGGTVVSVNGGAGTEEPSGSTDYFFSMRTMEQRHQRNNVTASVLIALGTNMSLSQLLEKRNVLFR